MNYFVQHEGEVQGPLSGEQIRSRLAQKSLSESTLVRPVGGMAWEPLDSAEEFRKPARRALDPKIAAVLVLLLVLGVGLSFSFYRFYKARADLAKGISNCRQIITTMRLYSSDDRDFDSDIHPELRPHNSNEYFRRMFVGGEADNEMIFGCPGSDFQPDGKIGQAPDFRQALESGENHWAVTAGLNDSASGTYPLVFENPTEATWPPKWNPDLAGTGKPGRTWPDGKVIIGMNDSSVSLLSFKAEKGYSVGGKPALDARGVFLQNILSGGAAPPTILNVAKKGEP